MKHKSPVLIVCSLDDVSFYRSFPLPGEELLVMPFGQAICSVLVREIDLVLLDCGHDVRFGLQLLEDLKLRLPTAPVLFVTGQSSEEIVINAFKSGARDFFKKPIPVFKVRDLITELLKAKRETREKRGPSTRFTNNQPMNGYLCKVGALQPAVMKVVCHIETHFQKSIDLEEMVDLANMSKYHFIRLFKQEVGMSPVRYLKFVRIQRAKELLKRSDLSVFSAGLRVGFQDVSNFNRNFKKMEGCTPSQYRARLYGKS